MLGLNNSFFLSFFFLLLFFFVFLLPGTKRSDFEFLCGRRRVVSRDFESLSRRLCDTYDRSIKSPLLFVCLFVCCCFCFLLPPFRSRPVHYFLFLFFFLSTFDSIFAFQEKYLSTSLAVCDDCGRGLFGGAGGRVSRSPSFVFFVFAFLLLLLLIYSLSLSLSLFCFIVLLEYRLLIHSDRCRHSMAFVFCFLCLFVCLFVFSAALALKFDIGR